MWIMILDLVNGEKKSCSQVLLTWLTEVLGQNSMLSQNSNVNVVQSKIVN